MNIHNIIKLIEHKGPNQIALLHHPDDVTMFEATQTISHHIIIKTDTPDHNFLSGRGWALTTSTILPQYYYHYTPIIMKPNTWCDLWGFYKYTDHTDLLIDRLQPGSKIVDIGTHHGKHAAYIATTAKKLKKKMLIYSIDQYDQYDQYDNIIYPAASWHNNILNWQNIGIGDMITSVTGDGSEFSDLFLDKSVDHIHFNIDRLKIDIENEIITWIPKLRTYGSISGSCYSDDNIRNIINKLFKKIYTKEKIDIWTSFKYHSN